MNKHKKWYTTVAVWILLANLACSSTGKCSAALRSPFFIDISRMPRSDGTNFEIYLTPLVSRDVHLPNGVILNSASNLASPFRSLVFDSFADLKAAIVGEWTINFPVRPPFQSSPEAYIFQISDFPESVLTRIPPAITSPQEGADVPPNFNMNWAWPTGVLPPNGRATLVRRYGPGNSLGQSGTGEVPSEELSALISAAYGDGALPERLELRAGSYESDVLASYVSTVVPQQVDSTYDFVIRSAFRSYSELVNVNVVAVPEPRAIALLTIGAAACIARRSRFAI